MMTEEDKKSIMKWRGGGKIALGMLGCLPGISHMAGIYTMKAAFAGVVVGAAARLVAWPLGSKKSESFGRNLQDKSIKLGFTGMALTMSPLGGAALIAEGTYNVAEGNIADYGFGAMSRWTSRMVSGVAQFGDHDYQPTFWMQEKHQKTTDIPPGDSRQTPTQSFDKTYQSSRPPQPSAPAKKEQEVEYAAVGGPVREGDGFTWTHVPAKYKDDPAKCPPAEMIVQKFNSEGELISQGPGKSRAAHIKESYNARKATSKGPSPLGSVGSQTTRDSFRSV